MCRTGHSVLRHRGPFTEFSYLSQIPPHGRASLVNGRNMNPESQWRLLVHNQWHGAAQTLPVHNPFTGERVAEVPLGDRALIQAALESAHSAFPVVRQIPPHARATLLLEVAHRIQLRRVDFVDAIISEAGKPVSAAEAEVDRAIMTFTLSGEEARRPMGELLGLDGVPQGARHLGWTRRFPLGVIAAVTPFNFPLNLAAHKVAPALATGNTMVLKPSPKTPLTAILLAEVLVESGMPAGQVNVITCNNEDVPLLLEDPRVKKLSFTGSAAVGWDLKSRAGQRKVTLELGGNAAVIVHSDADLQTAIPAIATGAFGLAGQSCISIQRILVHAPIYTEFRTALVRYIEEHIKTGDPRDPTTVVGPLIDSKALARAEALVADALSAGARLLCGGKRIGPCLTATLMEDVSVKCALASEEAFAPIASLQSYGSFPEAIAIANSTPYGLQAGVFTQDLARTLEAFENLEVGGVLINQVPTWRVEQMPYGGVRSSGFGREGVRYAMEEMTELRSLILRH
jgi:acyl-CoA reductase-like NAD-dependent aldehyde dehydrogenase